MQEEIHLKEAELSLVRAMLRKFVPNSKVLAYGSRVNGNAKECSDLDIAIFATASEKAAVADLEEAFEDSDLLFKVDLFVWEEIPPEFQANILQRHYLLQK